MKMKIVEHWSDRGFNMVIEAEFQTGGMSAGYGWIGYKRTDCVWLSFYIYNPLDKNLMSFEHIELYAAYSHTKKEKVSRFKSIKNKLTIAEAYQEQLAKVRAVFESRVNNELRDKELEDKDQLITDGLPDSLAGM